MEFLLSAKGIIIAILVLGVLVFVHELGHFLMAKLGGIRIDVFFIGFGKELWGFTRGETRYRIGIIPFGEYCKMKDEESKNRNDNMFSTCK
jgi:regulator of sigma E protease